MTKIVLTDTQSGFNLATINDNFDKIGDFINNKALSRDNPSGDPNQMVQTLDMNGQRVINLPAPISPNEPARLQDILNASIGILPILPASLVTFTPGHGVSATDVQHAIEQLGDASTGFTGLVSAEAIARSTADTNEANTRAAADTAINGTLTTVSNTVTGHTSSLATINSQLPNKPQLIANIAALRSINHTTFGVVETAGYYGYNDGGGSKYFYNPGDTTSADNGGSIIVDASGGRWYLYTSGLMNFKQWGAKGDGTTDDLGVMQTAINSVAPGTKLTLPNGTYRISNTLTVYGGRGIEGTSRASDVSNGMCQIRCDNGVSIAVATNQIDSTAAVTLRNFTINRAAGGIAAGTVGLRVFGSDQQVVEDVNILRHEVGIDVNACLSAYIHRVNTYYCTYAHVTLTGCVEPHFYHCRFGRNGAADFACVQYVAVNNGCDTVRFDTCQFNQSGNTVVQCVKWYGYNNSNGIFHFNNCHMENWTTAVLVADSGTTRIQRLKIVNSSITVVGSGAQFYIGAAGVLQDCSIMNNNLDVVCSFDSHTGIVFSGNNCSGTFSYNSGKYAVTGNIFAGNVTMTGAANHGALVGNVIAGTLSDTRTGSFISSGNI